MARPFDTTTKHLIEQYPQAWLPYLGAPQDLPVTVIDADLATVLAEADKVLRIDARDPWLAHLEMQSGYSPVLGDRMLHYNVLLQRRHALPVRSVAVLLRPEADGPRITGLVGHALPDGDCYLEFRYYIIRIWQIPADELLAGALGLLPLAPIAAVKAGKLPQVIRRMDERLRMEASPTEAGTLWTATFLLLGLRYSQDLAGELLKGIGAMKESTTYQAILEEGRLDEARAILLRQGRKRFGPPSNEIGASLDEISDLERLERMSERLLDVTTWEELIAEP